MEEYLDSKGKELEKGFYKTILTLNEYHRMSEGGEIIYFTGKFDEKNKYPLVMTFKNEREHSYSKYWIPFLKRINPEEINKKVNQLESELNWFKKD